MTRLATLILAASIPLLAIDTITLRDGSRYNGTFVGSSGGEITFDQENGGRQRFNISQVQRVEFGGSGSASAVVNRPGGLSADRPPAPSDSNPASVSIPAGTEMAVRTNEAIQSDSAAEGRTYSANIDRDVTDISGRVVVPRGSQAQLVVRNISPGGATSAPEVALDLQSVNVGGSTY